MSQADYIRKLLSDLAFFSLGKKIETLEDLPETDLREIHKKLRKHGVDRDEKTIANWYSNRNNPNKSSLNALSAHILSQYLERFPNTLDNERNVRALMEDEDKHKDFDYFEVYVEHIIKANTRTSEAFNPPSLLEKITSTLRAIHQSIPYKQIVISFFIGWMAHHYISKYFPKDNRQSIEKEYTIDSKDEIHTIEVPGESIKIERVRVKLLDNLKGFNTLDTLKSLNMYKIEGRSFARLEAILNDPDVHERLKSKERQKVFNSREHQELKSFVSQLGLQLHVFPKYTTQPSVAVFELSGAPKDGVELELRRSSNYLDDAIFKATKESIIDIPYNSKNNNYTVLIFEGETLRFTSSKYKWEIKISHIINPGHWRSGFDQILIDRSIEPL